MTGIQFWAVVLISCIVLALTYLTGFRDGAENERHMLNRGRRYE